MTWTVFFYLLFAFGAPAGFLAYFLRRAYVETRDAEKRFGTR